MASNTPRIDRLQKNYIINGDMRVAQRGTSFAAIAHLAYGLDRWKYEKSGAMVHTESQGTDVPTLAEANYLFQNNLRLNLTTPDTSIASTDFCFIQQYMEGFNWAHLAQKDFTLSFWVKATLVGTYCVAFLNSDNSRTYVAEYTVNTTNTWERKTIHVPASPSGGNWNYANGAGLRICFILAAGTNFQGTANVWNTSLFLATSNQVNGVNTGATDFRLTGVMVCEGTLTDPEFSTYGKDYDSEYAACQRYYETWTGRARAALQAGTNEYPCFYKVAKRLTPTITPVGDGGTAVNVSAEGFAYSTSSAATGNISFLIDAEL